MWGWCVSSASREALRIASKTPNRLVVISVLGVTQIFAWGSSYYLPAVLAKPIAADTGWSLSWVIGGLSLGLLTAGLVSPWVGRAIARRGGRPVLAVSAGLLAAGLSALALAHSLPAFLIAWLLVGLGMGAGLYDPAFATLGRLYGHGGRSAITTLTLFGGFASTVCWPLSAFLDAHLGWRGACLAYAEFQLAVAAPAYLFVLPREGGRPHPCQIHPQSCRLRRALSHAAQWPRNRAVFVACRDHHAELRDLDNDVCSLADDVAGQRAQPRCRRGPRRARRTFSGGRSHGRDGDRALPSPGLDQGRLHLSRGHRDWRRYGAMRQSSRLPWPFMARGIGLESIARGTLPLAVFGPERYPVVMGRIAMPSLIAQAAAPSIGTVLLEEGGVDWAMAVFVASAIVNVLLALSFFLMLRRRSSSI